MTENIIDDFQFTSKDLTLAIEEFYDRYLWPAETRLVLTETQQRVGFKATSLVWVGGRYRAMPR